LTPKNTNESRSFLNIFMAAHYFASQFWREITFLETQAKKGKNA